MVRAGVGVTRREDPGSSPKVPEKRVDVSLQSVDEPSILRGRHGDPVRKENKYPSLPSSYPLPSPRPKNGTTPGTDTGGYDRGHDCPWLPDLRTSQKRD